MGIVMEKSEYRMKVACEKLGVSGDVLRHLCNSGLIPQVRRDHLGRRVLADWQIDYARVLLQLRRAGFKTADLKRYTRLFRQGASTLAERKAMLETQKRQLWQELDEQRQSIDDLERQIELIDRELN